VFSGSFLAPLLLPELARPAAALRALIAAAILSQALPLHRLPRRQPVFLWGVWSAYLALVAGLLLPALWPGHETAWKHLLFIPGLLLLTLMIAARVAAAHGGELERVLRDRWLLIAVIVLLWLGGLSRVSVDWTPASRDRHLFYAAACAVLAVGLWAWRYAPLLIRRPPVWAD
jgi:NnrS protein